MASESPDSCIFCRIASGQIPSQRLYEDDLVVAFEDIHPVAPVHFLVIPREHIPTLDAAGPEHEALLGRMMWVASKLAREKGVAEGGYRQVINCNEAAGQVVFHLHLHIIGGRPLKRMG